MWRQRPRDLWPLFLILAVSSTMISLPLKCQLWEAGRTLAAWPPDVVRKKRYCYISIYGFLLVLHSLPWSIDISESQGPGTILQPFSFNCSSYMPTLELLSVRPPTSFFNNPSLHRQDKGIYLGKVRSWVQQLGIVGIKARSSAQRQKA